MSLMSARSCSQYFLSSCYSIDLGCQLSLALIEYTFFVKVDENNAGAWIQILIFVHVSLCGLALKLFRGSFFESNIFLDFGQNKGRNVQM